MYPFFDSTFLILIPALIIAAWAQSKVSSTYGKFSRIRNYRGLTGAQTARELLDSHGLFHVPVEVISGKLTDHYDPRKKVMRLSQEVYYGDSIAAVGIAAHETGHAIQHARNYGPLVLRNSITPVVSFSSNASWILFILGIFINSTGFIDLGIILFGAVVIFQLITLPVEFDASRRALTILEDRRMLYEDEIVGARKVLSAAAMTYLAAALTAVSQLIRLILISNRRSR